MSTNDKSKEVLRALVVLSRTSPLSINELRIVIALERIVARIEAHKVLRNKLIFKGGFVLLKELQCERFTRDLDALAEGIRKERIFGLTEEALAMDLHDGLYFAKPDIQDLLDQGQYGGYRIKIPFQIGMLPDDPRALKKLSRVHLDVGFGDSILPASRCPFRTILDGAKPLTWRVYPPESIFAEKLETLISRGSTNSRARDLYDLVAVFDTLKKKVLASAVRKTFSTRGTPIPDTFAGFMRNLDTTILRNAWGAVELQGAQMTFEECELRLRRILREVDKLFQ